jgi:hypothetical protein
MPTQAQSVNLKGRDNLGNLGIDWRIILKHILNMEDVCGLDPTGSE